ncbi:MAG: molybdopterin molybdotransferase MoeA [Candidatus Omnitrophica bacterium]|nr:molybdopterin molybdotransferase MoeA [Candidatus Omnitrophota bacterium]
MIRVEKARRIILNSIKPLQCEYARTKDGLDRIVASDVKAKVMLPPFDNSAMDGYALKAVDTKLVSGARPRIFKVVEDLPAGYSPKRRVNGGEATRIMTGAPLPAGADSVVMVEYTKKQGSSRGRVKDSVEVYARVKRGENVRRRGEDVKRGQEVLSKGSVLRPQEIGMLAALGMKSVKVARKPRVGILATGDELVGLAAKLTKGKIRNSNSFIISAQTAKCGGLAIDLGIARDTRDKVRKKIASGLKKRLDMLLVIGGISVGDYDLVKDVLLELGMRMKFWKVAQRPGKPLAFGVIKGIPVFGLPGNPVSSTISFEEYVRPSLLKMQGAKDLFRPGLWALMMEDFHKKEGLRYFVRAKISQKDGRFYCIPTGPQGSGIIKSLILADGIIVAPEEIKTIKKGQRVYVQLLRHGYDGGAI